jgi:hypothetical protein
MVSLGGGVVGTGGGRWRVMNCDVCGDMGGTFFLPVKVRKEGEWLIVSCDLAECGREVARLKLSAEPRPHDRPEMYYQHHHPGRDEERITHHASDSGGCEWELSSTR